MRNARSLRSLSSVSKIMPVKAKYRRLLSQCLIEFDYLCLLSPYLIPELSAMTLSYLTMGEVYFTTLTLPGIPTGLALDPEHNQIYVVDRDHRVVVLSLNGEILRSFRFQGKSTKCNIAISKRGWVYITDFAEGLVHILDREGKPIGESVQIRVSQSSFEKEECLSEALAISPDGNIIYVAGPEYGIMDAFSAEGIMLRRWTKYPVSEHNFGSLPGMPGNMVMDSKNRLLVADTEASCIRILNLSSDHKIESHQHFGLDYDPQISCYYPNGQFARLSGICLGDGYVYVTEGMERRVQVLAIDDESHTMEVLRHFSIPFPVISAFPGRIKRSKGHHAILAVQGRLYITEKDQPYLHIFEQGYH
jgi:DNA-binding beta-propeller fold protein YncE